MHSLPLFLEVRDRPVILIGRGSAAAAKRRLLERAGARILGEAAGIAAGARLAIVAPDAGEPGGDAAGVAAAAARLRELGLLVNVPDRPALCDVTFPAIVDRDPLLVAIGTGGVSAGLAAALRQRLEALLPAGLGGLARRLGAARPRLAARWPDPGDRRRRLAGLLAAGAPLDPLGAGGAGDSGAGDVDAALDRAEAGAAAMLVRLAIGSADPDDLTVRAARLLGQADRLYHHGDVPAAILARARADAERIAAAPPAAPAPGLSLLLEWKPA